MEIKTSKQTGTNAHSNVSYYIIIVGYSRVRND